MNNNSQRNLKTCPPFVRLIKNCHMMLIHFLIKMENKLLWWLLNGTAAFSFLFDIGLEVQFGVFIYSFIILWWWKWLNVEKV